MGMYEGYWKFYYWRNIRYIKLFIYMYMYITIKYNCNYWNINNLKKNIEKEIKDFHF